MSPHSFRVLPTEAIQLFTINHLKIMEVTNLSGGTPIAALSVDAFRELMTQIISKAQEAAQPKAQEAPAVWGRGIQSIMDHFGVGRSQAIELKNGLLAPACYQNRRTIHVNLSQADAIFKAKTAEL